MTIDLGGEQVDLERIECMEMLGKPFTLTVDLISTLGEVDILPHLGKPVAIKVFEDEELLRHFHGLVSDAEYVEETNNGYHYRLTARPFTYWMSHGRDMAIFQEKSALDIIKAVFAAAGATDVRYSVTRTLAPREYCVQYRESDFAFVTRLMEEEGLYYFWEHAEDKHTLVVCDSGNAHQPSKPATLIYNPEAGQLGFSGSAWRTTTGGAGWFLLRWHERVSSAGQAKTTFRDFDFKKPERPIQGAASDKQAHPNDAAEVYTYPAGFTEERVGAELGRLALEEMRSGRQNYTGETHASGLACGTKLTVVQHPVERLVGEYLVTSTFHSILSESYRSGAGSGVDEAYNVRFDAIPAATPFRMPRTTPKPVVQGLETAIVSGPDGEEIYTDEYGRVKVRFHWDRSDASGEKTTCFIRVAQFGGLGNVILPRVGQEVMVDFLHGDPDHPIVMGWVFNNSLKPVYDLPANKTRSLWRTKRYGETGQYPNAKNLDTGAPGANELRFEDKGGSEEVFLHAERDMNTRIRFEETHHVGATQHIMVGYDRTDDVGNDETTTIGKNQTLTVTGNQTETIKAKREVEVKATDKLTVGQSQTVEAGTTIKITANTSITLTCGPSSIKIEPSGITIKGPIVSSEATGMATFKGAKTDILGNGLVNVNAPLVKIN